MAKIIRPRYPVEVSIGLLLLIFLLSGFLSLQIFKDTWTDMVDGGRVLSGMALVGAAVVIMVLILWEDFLFPIKVTPTKDEVVFRNHRHKLFIQMLIYLAIPVIFVFIYLFYEINPVRFVIWASILMGFPVAVKLFSGVRNYNDFLKLSYTHISYQNNEKTGTFDIRQVKQLVPIRDDYRVLHKIEVVLDDGQRVTIDLDEMELEEYFLAIDQALSVHYKNLLQDKIA